MSSERRRLRDYLGRQRPDFDVRAPASECSAAIITMKMRRDASVLRERKLARKISGRNGREASRDATVNSIMDAASAVIKADGLEDATTGEVGPGQADIQHAGSGAVVGSKNNEIMLLKAREQAERGACPQEGNYRCSKLSRGQCDPCCSKT